MGKSLFSMLSRSRATRTTSVSGSELQPGQASGPRRRWYSPSAGGRAASAGGRPALGQGDVELALEVPDLVPELGRVLEPEVLGGGQHLLLQLHDRALDLGRLHRSGGAPAAAPGAGHLRLRLQELGDVADPLDDRLRR